jgi:hypothetical protein
MVVDGGGWWWMTVGDRVGLLTIGGDGVPTFSGSRAKLRGMGLAGGDTLRTGGMGRIHRCTDGWQAMQAVTAAVERER